MIEMNVAEKNVAHVLRREPGLAKAGNDVVKRRFWPCIEKGKSIVGFERRSGNNAAAAKLAGVENNNQGRIKK